MCAVKVNVNVSSMLMCGECESGCVFECDSVVNLNVWLMCSECEFVVNVNVCLNVTVW